MQRHYVQFLEVLKFGLTTRAEFERLVRVDPDTLTDLERAARFPYLQRTAFGGKVSGRNFGVDKTRPARFNLIALEPLLEDLHTRLSGVTIECLDWTVFIPRYDGPDTLFYLDPPYWGCEDDYGYPPPPNEAYADEAIGLICADCGGRVMAGKPCVACGWEQDQPNGMPTVHTSTFRFVAVGDLECRPPEFLVADLIETDTLGLIFGDPACGKSFLASDLALSVATGIQFHGRHVKQGTVFYIAGEGHNGLVRRFHAWAKHRGQRLAEVPMFMSECAAQFLDSASAQNVERSVRALSQAHGPPALIVVDTLARNFGPGDENSTPEMNRFIAAMDKLRANWPGCVLLIVHHSGHGEKGRARGAMTLKAALDFEYRLEKQDSSLTLTNTKMKDAEPPPAMGFTLTGVEISEGVKSAVLVEGEAVNRAPKVTGQAKIALQAFSDALAQHGVVKHGDLFPPGQQCVALEHWREFCDRHSLSGGASESANRNAFNRAKLKLHNSGIIRVIDGFAWRVDGATHTET